MMLNRWTFISISKICNYYEETCVDLFIVFIANKTICCTFKILLISFAALRQNNEYIYNFNNKWIYLKRGMQKLSMPICKSKRRNHFTSCFILNFACLHFILTFLCTSERMTNDYCIYIAVTRFINTK